MKKTLLPLFLILTLFATAQNINIPDPVLKNALVNLPCVDIDNDYTLDVDADSNDDGEISVSETLAVTSLQFMGLEIQSAEGLQYFSNLQILNLFNNNLTTLDVSMFTQLRELDCSVNHQLHTLTLGNLPNLEVLNCGVNRLTNLNLSQTPKLWFFTCQFNQLAQIDVSGLPRLQTFQCDNNLFTTLDLSNLFELKSFWCYQNPHLVSVDVRNNVADDFIIFSLSFCPLLETFCIDSGDNFTMAYDGPTPSFCTLATKESNGVKPITFYPNPAKDRLYFNESINEIEMFETSGRTILKKKIEGKVIDLSDLQSGVYLMRYSIDGISASGKLIKN